MNRSPLLDCFGLRSKVHNKRRVSNTHLGIEPLEERRLLSAYDVLVSTYFDTSGSSVLRYDETTQHSAGVVAGGLQATGLAVAPDGSYYVSSQANYAVLHFSNSGASLGELGAGELEFPGTLAFGPNGNLYVADLGAGAIYQFNTASQELVGALSLPLGFTPAGFTFAADGSGDLIVGDYNSGEVLRYHDGAPTTLIPGSSGSLPYAMLAPSSGPFRGDLLIANDIPGQSGYCQIMVYNAATGNTAGPSISLTPADGAGSQGYPAYPSSLLLDTDGNLLVGCSPDDYDDGAVEKFNSQSLDSMGAIVTGVGEPSGLALLPSEMTVSATDWTNSGFAGVTLTRDSGNLLHVYGTTSTTDVVSSQSVDNVGQVQISGPDNAADALTIDFGGGSPIPPSGVLFDGGSGTATNTVAISGSADLSGTMETTGSVLFGQGSQTSGTRSSSPFSIESGTIVASLAGSGGLIKTGPGTATVSGSNHYQGVTTVSGGTLVVTASSVLPAGSGLTVGADGGAIFDVSNVVQTPLASSTTAATAGEFASTPAAAVAAPWQGPALVANSASASVPRPGRPSATSAAQPAESPTSAAIDTLWRSYPRSTGPAAEQVHRVAAYPASLNAAVASSSAGDSTAETDRRLAALDAVLTQYDTP